MAKKEKLACDTMAEERGTSLRYDGFLDIVEIPERQAIASTKKRYDGGRKRN